MRACLEWVRNLCKPIKIFWKKGNVDAISFMDAMVHAGARANHFFNYIYKYKDIYLSNDAFLHVGIYLRAKLR